MEYFALGILYENFSEDFRQAFKECEINPSVGLIRTYSSIRTLAAKKQTKLESETVLYSKHREKKTQSHREIRM